MVAWHGDPYQIGGLRGGAAEVSLCVREGKNVNTEDLIYKKHDYGRVLIPQNLFKLATLKLRCEIITKNIFK